MRRGLSCERALARTTKIRLSRSIEVSGKWTRGKEGEWFRELFNVSKESVVFVYKSAQKQQPDFVHRNWMRNIKSAESLYDYIIESPSRTMPPIRYGTGTITRDPMGQSGIGIGQANDGTTFDFAMGVATQQIHYEW
jgi:hypothetical protein